MICRNCGKVLKPCNSYDQVGTECGFFGVVHLTSGSHFCNPDRPVHGMDESNVAREDPEL